MENLAETLIALGALFLLGLATDLLGRYTRLPRVTLLLVFGFLIGPSALDLLPDHGQRWTPLVTDMALVMVGFLLGGKLTRESLRRTGRPVLWISVAEVGLTAGVVLAGLLAIGTAVEIALVLAAISTATDPAAVADVAHEARADGRFTRTLLGIVAVDDAWGLIAFSLCFAAAQAIAGQEPTAPVLLAGLWEVAGAVVLGVALGLPLAAITGRVAKGEPTLVEALGGVFLCGGLAIQIGVSFLLAAMVMGCVVANLARHHRRPFHAIEAIEWPFLVLFFVLSGAALDVESLTAVGGVLVAYIALRALGRLIGAKVGVAASGETEISARWMGAALLPQAGVALGMALLASQRIPSFRESVLPVVIAATVLFEVVGPIFTRRALVRAGEAGNARTRA